jgi:hypothetical protein
LEEAQGATLFSCSASNISGGDMSIFTILFIILLIAWILGWGVFHVAGAMIHILLIAAVIALILHFVRGTTRAV